MNGIRAFSIMSGQLKWSRLMHAAVAVAGLYLGWLLAAAPVSGQELLWQTYRSAGLRAMQEGRTAEAERLLYVSLGYLSGQGSPRALRFFKAGIKHGASCPLYSQARTVARVQKPA
jgi:hypothetical protein